MSTVRYVPKGTQYTHPELDEEKLNETRALLIRYAIAPDIRVKMREEAIKFPMRACDVCRGSGVESLTGPNAGSCSRCSGLRRVEMSTPEIRQAYRETRSQVALKLGTTEAIIDRIVESYLRDESEPTPGQWLHAMRQLEKKGR